MKYFEKVKVLNTGRTRFKKGNVPHNKGIIKPFPKCYICGVELRNRKSKTCVNHKNKGIPKSKLHKEKLREAKLKNPVKYWLGKTGEKSNNWLGGKSFEPYTIDWTETLKRSIRERDHYICKICNLYGNYIHHIDYNKKNCNPDNLITLCHSCHSKTNHNRNYWIDYFKNKVYA